MKQGEDIGQAFVQNDAGDGLEAVDLTELRDAAAVPVLPCRFDVRALPRWVAIDDNDLMVSAGCQQRQREPCDATSYDSHPHGISITAARIPPVALGPARPGTNEESVG
jgi:hypothetical protein